MKTPTGHDGKEPQEQSLRPLLARIWRDYLSHHRAALFLSMLCAATAGGLSALTQKLL